MDNYFQILNLPITVDLSREELDKALYKIQSIHHPDKLIHLPQAERAAMSLNANLANMAYKVLKKEEDRVEHLLALNGFVAVQQNVSQALLLEAFEWREALNENREKLVTELKLKYKQMLDNCKMYLRKNEFSKAMDECVILRFIKRFLDEIGEEL